MSPSSLWQLFSWTTAVTPPGAFCLLAPLVPGTLASTPSPPPSCALAPQEMLQGKNRTKLNISHSELAQRQVREDTQGPSGWSHPVHQNILEPQKGVTRWPVRSPWSLGLDRISSHVRSFIHAVPLQQVTCRERNSRHNQTPWGSPKLAAFFMGHCLLS